MTTRRTPFEVIWCSLDPKPLPLNYRHEEETGLYYAGDYNLRGRTPDAMSMSMSMLLYPVR